MTHKNIFARLAVIIFAMTISLNMTAENKKLPAPDTTGGMPMNSVVAQRHSVREFDPAKAVDDATLGQLLWMAVGVNRPDAKSSRFGVPANRCNPTALNWQEIHAYVFGLDGVYKYLPDTHSLALVKEGDHRALLAGTPEFAQDFVMNAPYTILLVADMAELPDGERTKAMALVDAGIACENINLACTSLGLATVPRATMDSEAISKLLGLNARQLPVINNPVGYAAE